MNKKVIIYTITIFILIIVIASIVEISIRNILKKEEPEQQNVQEEFREDWSSYSEKDKIKLYLENYADQDNYYNLTLSDYMSYSNLSYQELQTKVNAIFTDYDITALQYIKYEAEDKDIYICSIELTSNNLINRIKTKTIDNLVIIEEELGNYKISFDNFLSKKQIYKTINKENISYTILDSYQFIDKIICNMSVTNKSNQQVIIETSNYPINIQDGSVSKDKACNNNEVIEIEPNTTKETMLEFEQEYRKTHVYRIKIENELIKI